jgi:hypothetical protein
VSDRPTAAAHGEGRRALIASTLGLALGVLVALFMRRDEVIGDRRRRGWRGRSAT